MQPRRTCNRVFQVPELSTMQVEQCLLPCSSQCSCCLSGRLAFRQARSYLVCTFDHARHHGDGSGCQMPPTMALAGGFLSILGFKMHKLGMTAQQLGEVNWVLLTVTFSKVRA